MKLTPKVSEKAVEQSSRGVYVFGVSKDATKKAVAKAVSDTFKVKVAAVNMLIQSGKPKVFRRVKGRRPDFKKAYVTLAKGEKISLFEESSKDEAKKTKKEAKK